jgi:predicted transcriptional regulator
VKNYRTRIDIIVDILKAVNSGYATKMKIMYRVFISYNQQKQYLPMLIERGLITYNPDTRTSKTTEKGLMLLETYNLLVDLMLKKKEKISE